MVFGYPPSSLWTVEAEMQSTISLLFSSLLFFLFFLSSLLFSSLLFCRTQSDELSLEDQEWLQELRQLYLGGVDKVVAQIKASQDAIAVLSQRATGITDSLLTIDHQIKSDQTALSTFSAGSEQHQQAQKQIQVGTDLLKTVHAVSQWSQGLSEPAVFSILALHAEMQHSKALLDAALKKIDWKQLDDLKSAEASHQKTQEQIEAETDQELAPVNEIVGIIPQLGRSMDYISKDGVAPAQALSLCKTTRYVSCFIKTMQKRCDELAAGGGGGDVKDQPSDKERFQMISEMDGMLHILRDVVAEADSIDKAQSEKNAFKAEGSRPAKAASS